MVKKSVNQDDPTVYHLFYADEQGSAGSDLTFFEYPGAQRGRRRPRAWCTGSAGASPPRTRCRSGPSAWPARASPSTGPRAGALRFADPEGLEHELVVDASGDEPLIAEHPEVPAEHALRGLRRRPRVRVTTPSRAAPLLEQRARVRALRRRLGGARRLARQHLRLRRAARRAGDPGRGHGPPRRVGDACPTSRRRGASAVLRAGARPTPVIDRFYFRSVYFREPSGVLFEIATIGPGFTTDEPLETLGEKLALPPDYEHLRAQIEATVTPLPRAREPRASPTPPARPARRPRGPAPRGRRRRTPRRAAAARPRYASAASSRASLPRVEHRRPGGAAGGSPARACRRPGREVIFSSLTLMSGSLTGRRSRSQLLYAPGGATVASRYAVHAASASGQAMPADVRRAPAA